LIVPNLVHHAKYAAQKQVKDALKGIHVHGIQKFYVSKLRALIALVFAHQPAITLRHVQMVLYVRTIAPNPIVQSQIIVRVYAYHQHPVMPTPAKDVAMGTFARMIPRFSVYQ
jgi:hypothetical protein